MWKNIFKFLSSLSFIFLCVFFTSRVVLASEIKDSEVNSAFENLNEIQENLIEYLKGSDLLDLDQSISDFFSQEENILSKEDFDLINDYDKTDTLLQQRLRRTDDEIVENKILKSVVIGDYYLEFYTNGMFSVENLKEQEELMTSAASGTVSGTASRSYKNLLGITMFTLTVECKFNYNGSKATYHSGFDAYYKKGFLSVWQVSDFKGVKEQSGTSYVAYGAGNFHYGFEYNGAGIVFQDLYVKHTLTCSKTGSLTKNYITK